jgi:hypothetical protein
MVPADSAGQLNSAFGTAAATGPLMQTVLILLIVSALTGVVIGLKYRVFVVGLSAPVIAAIAAIALRDLGFVAAAAITFACLTVHQMGYLAGAWLRVRHATSPDALSCGEPSDDRNGNDR